MRKDYKNQIHITGVSEISCSFIIHNLTGKYVYPKKKKEEHGMYYTEPLLIPNNYFGIFLHTKNLHAFQGSAGVLQYSDDIEFNFGQSADERKEHIWEIEWENSFCLYNLSEKFAGKNKLLGSKFVQCGTMSTGDSRHLIYKITLNPVPKN